MLNDIGVLKRCAVGMYRYRVCGKLSYWDATLSELYACEVPLIYEAVTSDVRGSGVAGGGGGGGGAKGALAPPFSRENATRVLCTIINY